MGQMVSHGPAILCSEDTNLQPIQIHPSEIDSAQYAEGPVALPGSNLAISNGW